MFPRFKLLCGSLLLGTVMAFSAVAASPATTPVVVSFKEVSLDISLPILSSPAPTVIELLDSSDQNQECRSQGAVFRQTAQRYAGRVNFVQVQMSKQDKSMLERTRSGICPTHLFVLSHDRDGFVAKRIWGFLDANQLEELVQEFYGISP